MEGAPRNRNVAMLRGDLGDRFTNYSEIRLCEYSKYQGRAEMETRPIARVSQQDLTREVAQRLPSRN